MKYINPIRKFYLVVLVIILTTTIANAQVVINEYSASNLSQYLDNYGKHEDWIELYNGSASAVNIGGYYLSDDSTQATKYPIPTGTTIAAGGFLRFWCSGRDLYSGTSYHTNFKLTQTKNNKEDIVLADPSGTIIDGTRVTKVKVGCSVGRKPNGGTTWGIFTSPTINASNNNATQYVRYAEKPDFNFPAGFYPSSFSVTITTTEPNSSIRYTIDGTLPTSTSPLYSGPVLIPSTAVLKAITFSTDPTVLTSFVEYNTYFINVTHNDMRVVSIAANQLNTLANGSGSLVPVGSFEYFDRQHNRTANSYGEFNRHGQDSWASSHRSLDFVSRDEMGYNHSLEEKIFDITPRDNFQRLILRAAGDDNFPADYHTANLGSCHIRDAYIHTLAQRGGMNLDVRTGEKAVVYLNGQYWGLYDLRENPDDHDYTDFYYGQGKYKIQYIETWGNTWAEYGGSQALSDWNSLYNYIMANSMTNPVNYQYVIDRYDATSLADYVLANSFTVCSDWLNYNTGWWRGLDSAGTHKRWGYILWDNDATFGHYINYTDIPNTNYNAEPCDAETSPAVAINDFEGHLQVLNKLRTNPDFNQWYISRMIDMWNTVFSCDNMLAQFDSVIAYITPEMPAQCTRWNGVYSDWQANVQVMRSFISQRCNYMSTGIMGCYNLNGPYTLTVNADPVGAGSVRLNTLTHTQLPWTGTYFGGIDNIVEAIANANYQFNNWSSTSQVFNPSPTISLAKVNLTSSDSIIAHFGVTSPVIEIAGQSPSLDVYPTAFSSQTSMNFSIPETSPVTVKLYSLLGTEVAAIVNDEKMDVGYYSLDINLSNKKIPAGIYILDFIAGDYHKSVRLVYSPK